MIWSMKFFCDNSYGYLSLQSALDAKVVNGDPSEQSFQRNHNTNFVFGVFKMFLQLKFKAGSPRIKNELIAFEIFRFCIFLLFQFLNYFVRFFVQIYVFFGSSEHQNANGVIYGQRLILVEHSNYFFN